jgi:4-oxalocrotonate tautomerase
MPFVNIKITREGKRTTADQKEEIIAGVTKVLVDVLGRGEHTTVVIIEEVDPENYGIGGESITRRRKDEAHHAEDI